MFKWKLFLISFISFIVLFAVLLLTLTHGSFVCEVNIGDEIKTCAEYGKNEDETKVCQGTVFTITAEEQGANVTILCPWTTGTIFTTAIGMLGAMVYTVLSVLHKMEKIAATRSLRRLFGIVCLVVMLFSSILMLFDVGGGGSKCKEFSDDSAEANLKNAHCGNSVFGITFILMLMSMSIFGIQVFKKNENEEPEGYQIGKFYVNSNEQTKFYSMEN